MNDENCFLTLTFDEEHCPPDMSIRVEDLQKFNKRLRKKYQDKTIRFYAAGEYGEKLLRPHYHLCIFGHDFADKELWSKRNGNPFYISAELMQLWPFGNSLISDVTFESAAYVARYIMKKITGDEAKEHYLRADENGECWEVKPEFNTMSRKPGIGQKWYEKYKTDMFPKGHIHVNGRPVPAPKYYDNQYQLEEPWEFHKLKQARLDRMHKQRHDNTEARLETKEKVKRAQLKQLSRKLE